VRGLQTAGGAPLTARGRRVRTLAVVAAVAYLLDLVSKIVVVATLEHREPLHLVGDFLRLRVIRNSGAAFGVGTSMTIVFTVIAVGVVVAILRSARRLYSTPWAVTLGLLLGGALGNLTDRIFRAPAPFQGHVVDFISFPHYPVFNLGDSAICVGGVLAVILAWRGFRLDGTRDEAVRDDEPKDDDIRDEGAAPRAAEEGR
jgi:signal peptidase II